MMCQICNAKDATIHLTEIVNGQMIDLHICEQCAKEKEVDLAPPVSFNELLSGLFDFTSHTEDHASIMTCKKCGLTYEEFKKKGRLGCADCYESFKSLLLPIIKRVHSATHHMGKVPTQYSGEAKIDHGIKELNEQLKQLIEREEFEEAIMI